MTSHRIDAAFERQRSAGRAVLVPYVTAGDPSLDVTCDIVDALARAGADIVEIGVPFSDPMADGPVIQRAAERALARGTSLRDVLAAVARLRARHAALPFVLMGYANPIEAMGVDAFADAARDAGVDGVIVVDYPPEEAEAFAHLLRARGLAPIFLIAPTTKPARMKRIAELAAGYVYYVSLKGVTGAAHLDVADVAAHLAAIRQQVALPVGVGFGIRDAASARAIAKHADAVVIGSRIIEEIEGGAPAEAAARTGAWLSTIRRALDARGSA